MMILSLLIPNVADHLAQMRRLHLKIHTLLSQIVLISTYYLSTNEVYVLYVTLFLLLLFTCRVFLAVRYGPSTNFTERNQELSYIGSVKFGNDW